MRREDVRPSAGTGAGPDRSAWRIVAVEAITLGRTFLPSTSQVQSWSTAVSYSPTSVPSGPLIRCSSSWMIRSGGRSGVVRRRPGRRAAALASWGGLVGVLDLGRAEPVPLAVAVDLAEEHLRPRPSTASGRTCPPWRSAATAAAGRSPRPPPPPAAPRPAACRRLKRHWPNLSPQ